MKAMAFTTALMALAWTSNAQAVTVIDFNSLAHQDEYRYQRSVYVENGFAFSNQGYDSKDVFEPWAFTVWGNHPTSNWAGYNADPGGAALTVSYDSSRNPADPGAPNTIVKHYWGGLFDLVSIDLAGTYNNASPYSHNIPTEVRFTFHTLTGSSDEIVTIDNLPGLQRFGFNKTGLTAFEFETLRPSDFRAPASVQFDNVTLFATSPGVPEPTSWGMLLLGFGALGASIRRSRGRQRVLATG